MQFFVPQLRLSLQRIRHRALNLQHMTNFLISLMKCIFPRNNSNNFKPGIVSYPYYWKTLQGYSVSQLIHKWCKNHAILRDISAGTTCRKKLHSTYLFFCQTTPRSFAVVVTSWNFFTQLLNEQASKKLTRLVTVTNWNIKLSFMKCRPLGNHPSPSWYARLM